MKPTTKTHEAIDENLEVRQGIGFRRHLGASVIGKECARQVWYIFRWAKRVRHRARILRLFDRGNREEERFVTWLRSAGVHVEDRDLTTGEQFRIEDHDGHFGGSLDAKLYDIPDLPGEWVVGEFKTHSQKSFNELTKKGVKVSKPEHYAQMQVYMRKTGLRAALYLAVNKNDDDLYTEVVYIDEAAADRYIDRAGKIIEAAFPPQRINESSAWYLCQWCDYSDICHNGTPLAQNCRTCLHSRPVKEGRWHCFLYDYNLSEGEQRMGCQSHTPIPQ